jgi:hypothetical protein
VSGYIISKNIEKRKEWAKWVANQSAYLPDGSDPKNTLSIGDVGKLLEKLGIYYCRIFKNFFKYAVFSPYLMKDLGIRMVTAEIKKQAKNHEDRLHQHTNVEAIQLLDNERTVRRLKRLKPFELV